MPLCCAHRSVCRRVRAPLSPPLSLSLPLSPVAECQQAAAGVGSAAEHGGRDVAAGVPCQAGAQRACPPGQGAPGACPGRFSGPVTSEGGSPVRGGAPMGGGPGGGGGGRAGPGHLPGQCFGPGCGDTTCGIGPTAAPAADRHRREYAACDAQNTAGLLVATVTVTVTVTMTVTVTVTVNLCSCESSQ